MKTKLLFAFALLLSFVCKSQAPVFSWAKQLEGTVIVISSTTDASGNFYTTGTYAGTIDFDPGPGIDTLTDKGFGDIFISKMDSSGNLLWVKTIGGPSYDQGNAVMTDASGNVYLAGFFNTDSVDFDPGPGVFLMSADQNSFVLKLDMDGNFLWAKQLAGISGNYAVSAALDPQNNILVTGQFGGDADFDPNAGSYNLTSSGSDIYIWKLDNNGNFIWAKQVGAISPGTRSYSVASDGHGNVLLSGALTGTIDLDPGAAVYNLSSQSTFAAAFILKLNPAGDFEWAGKIDNADIGLGGNSILADAAGNSYIGGSFTGTVDFDPGASVQNLTAVNGNDHFLLKLDPSGEPAWLKQMADVKGMALDALGNIYTSGNSVHSFGAGGSIRWVSDSSRSVMITVDRFGGIYTSGVFNGTVDFDPGVAIYDLTDTADAAFVQKLNEGAILGIGAHALTVNTIGIYPNPADDRICISSGIACDLVLVNSLGYTVKSISLEGNKPLLLTTADLPDGLYLLSDGQLGRVREKVMIRH